MMIDLTDELLKWGNKKKERIVGRYSVSELWGLLTINSRTGKPYTSPKEWLNPSSKTFQSCFKMWEGTMKHKAVEELLPETWKTEIKKEYQYKDITLVGQIDALSKDTVLEIKTSADLMFEAKPWHLYQLRIYLSLFEKPKGIIVQPIIKKNMIFLKTIGKIEKDDKWFNKQLELLDRFHKKMRTKAELNSKEFQEDLMPLYHMLVARKIPCKMRLHPAAESEPQVKKIIGYFPSGTNQILIEKDRTTYSVIRGMVSFGDYEIMNIGKGKKFEEPERFGTPKELIEALTS